MRPIDPAAFAARLQVEAEHRVADGSGGFLQQWKASGWCRARLVPLSAAARERAETRFSEIRHEITVRYRTDLGPGMRLRLGKRVFAIDSVHDPDESRRYLVCRTREER